MQDYGPDIFDAIDTKSAWKKSLKKEYIRVNGSIAGKSTFIKGGETLELRIPEQKTTGKEFAFPLKVLFEDDYLALIHKPAGIAVSGNRFKTIANALSQNLRKSNLPGVCIPHPVHRLDFATTGILLIGKNNSSIRALNKQFEERKVEKIYYAVTIGEMKSGGVLESSIDGKIAITTYEVCQSVPSKRFGMLNLVRLIPETGRRHQLRIQLSEMGNSILGDKDYGKEGLMLKGKGMYLHAYSLKFTHPVKNEIMQVSDTLPLKFRKIFDDPILRI